METTSKRAEAERILGDVLRLCGIEAEVRTVEDEERLRLEVHGPDVGRVIGKKGAMLDALQYLINKALYRDRDAAGQKPVVVDAEGYRERRAESLVDLAHRLAEKARSENRVVAVAPMSAHDRRIMHLAVSELPGVTTRSEGEGAARRMLIVPDPKKVAGEGRPDALPRRAPARDGAGETAAGDE
jgi:spoIIIJ-associated protein